MSKRSIRKRRHRKPFVHYYSNVTIAINGVEYAELKDVTYKDSK